MSRNEFVRALATIAIFSSCMCACSTPAFGQKTSNTRSITLSPSVEIPSDDLGAASPSDADLVSAKKFFEKYVQLERDFNPYQAELYSPNAQILLKKPSGEVVISGEQIQQIIEKAMPVARSKHDTNTYTGTTYSRFKDTIRIKSMRKSNLTGVTTPHLLVIRTPDNRNWLIVQEIVEIKN